MRSELLKQSQIYNGVAVAAFVIDENCQVTHWNPACEILTGVPAAEIIGTDKHQEIFYPTRRPLMADLIVKNADIHELNKNYKGIIRESQLVDHGYEGEDFFPTLGAEGRWLYFTAAPLKDDLGNIVGAIETLQDISEHRIAEQKLRNSEIRYRLLFETANDAIFIFEDGRVIDCNEKATKLLKCTRDDIFGRTVLEFCPEYQPSGIRSEDVLEKTRQNFTPMAARLLEWRFYKMDGSEFDAEVSLTRFSISDKTYAMAIVRDVTEKKQMIETLRQNKRELDEKSRYLEKVNEALKASLDHREVEKRSIEENMLARIRQFINPYLGRLEQCKMDVDAKAYLKIVETNLGELVSQFSNSLFAKFMDFTPTEIRVANFIREGYGSKEIADFMGLAPSSIQWHRKNIRAKLGLVNKSMNLYTYLNSFSH